MILALTRTAKALLPFIWGVSNRGLKLPVVSKYSQNHKKVRIYKYSIPKFVTSRVNCSHCMTPQEALNHLLKSRSTRSRRTSLSLIYHINSLMTYPQHQLAYDKFPHIYYLSPLAARTTLTCARYTYPLATVLSTHIPGFGTKYIQNRKMHIAR